MEVIVEIPPTTAGKPGTHIFGIKEVSMYWFNGTTADAHKIAENESSAQKHGDKL